MKRSIVANTCASLLTILFLFGCNAKPNTSVDLAKPIALHEVPEIKVIVDCKECKIRDNVPSLILEGYKQAATKAGMAISSATSADLSIIEYSDRSDAARFFIGIFAGKDHIKANVIYEGKNFVVEDYYLNAWQGIESLSRKIGKMTFEKFKE